MSFTPRQQAAMRLILDTFVPGDRAGFPSASDLGAPEYALDLASLNPRKAERRQLETVLRLWDSRGLGVALGGRPRKFSSLSQSEREQVLLGLAESRVGAKRALFGALKGVAGISYYVSSDADGRSAAWDEIGFPGPLGLRADAPAAPLSPTRVSADTELDCDVVVVGSGAGGGTAAGVLAAAGLDVVVLEAGEYHDDADFGGNEKVAFRDLYAPAPTVSTEGQIQLIAGSGLGGGTVVNYTTSFRTPDHVREEWASYGAEQFAGDEYDSALDAVIHRLGVNVDHDLAAPRDALLETGAKALGWSVAAMPRNVKGCDMGVECGRCGLGCRLGAKQSVAKTWLVDAAARGARLLVGTRAMKMLSENGRAAGVHAVSGEHTVTVRARAVVVAAGSIQTPALLKRSGLGNPNIGRYLRLHPVSVVWGRFDDRVEPWVGSMQSRYVDELRDLDGDGYGVLFETGPATPGLGSVFMPWRGAAAHRAAMAELGHLAPMAVLVRDKDSGEVKVDRSGEAVVHYKLSPHDTEHLMQGIEGAAKIWEAAGANRIATAQQTEVAYSPGRGTAADFASRARAAGAAPGTLALASLHIMGSARMGGTPEVSAVNPDGEAWDLPGLVVADASCFPTASGVNPMISIESIAYMNASRLAARLA
ncbi:GMC family oxidoreductase N-terminal domain-containing protein [Nocardioides speluncae]|uniref:GMC family oxidoreductase N-terminal domain-containing protein n=1 Tax=Nocardioides speluncae TaxID=2670337 RepID=UPI000D6A01CE|nr:GMC family oxidoreductase N-terminal domain-containing protein [Nocardioides speluncae]